ncbi:hypothetical protein T492DRAFT_833425 [Pavlovales sp. CCMP2436]|nr:hypothetical protein T492DRAFT_833425 [Pavlovales sp. CCMP2436]
MGLVTEMRIIDELFVDSLTVPEDTLSVLSAMAQAANNCIEALFPQVSVVRFLPTPLAFSCEPLISSISLDDFVFRETKRHASHVARMPVSVQKDNDIAFWTGFCEKELEKLVQGDQLWFESPKPKPPPGFQLAVTAFAEELEAIDPDVKQLLPLLLRLPLAAVLALLLHGAIVDTGRPDNVLSGRRGHGRSSLRHCRGRHVYAILPLQCDRQLFVIYLALSAPRHCLVYAVLLLYMQCARQVLIPAGASVAAAIELGGRTLDQFDRREEVVVRPQQRVDDIVAREAHRKQELDRLHGSAQLNPRERAVRPATAPLRGSFTLPGGRGDGEGGDQDATHLLLALVCCASLAGGAEVQTLSPETNKETVFLDRQPWVVVCLSGSKSDPVHDVVGKATAAAGFPSDVCVGVLNCRAKLPSGKTAIVRLKLDDNIEPLIFVVAGGEVTQVTPNGLNKHAPKATAKQPRELFPSSKAHARSLAAFVAFATEVRVAKITSDKELSACLATSCALFLTAQDVSSSQQTLIDKLGAKFRHTHFAVLNLGRYEFSLESKLPAQPTRQEPRLLLLRQLEAVEAEEKKEEKKGAKGKAAQQLGARAYRGDWSAGGMEGFMTEALGSETDVVRLKQPPRRQGQGRCQGRGRRGCLAREGAPAGHGH